MRKGFINNLSCADEFAVKQIFTVYHNGYVGDMNLIILMYLQKLYFEGAVTEGQYQYLLKHYNRYADKSIERTYHPEKFQ